MRSSKFFTGYCRSSLFPFHILFSRGSTSRQWISCSQRHSSPYRGMELAGRIQEVTLARRAGSLRGRTPGHERSVYPAVGCAGTGLATSRSLLRDARKLGQAHDRTCASRLQKCDSWGFSPLICQPSYLALVMSMIRSKNVKLSQCVCFQRCHAFKTTNR